MYRVYRILSLAPTETFFPQGKGRSYGNSFPDALAEALEELPVRPGGETVIVVNEGSADSGAALFRVKPVTTPAYTAERIT